MTLVARGEYLVRGEGNAPPAGTALLEALHRSLAVGAGLGVGGNQVRYRFTVPRYGEGLSVLHCPQEFGQAGFGFSSLNLTHVTNQPVVLTILFYGTSLSRSTTEPEKTSPYAGSNFGRVISGVTSSKRTLTGMPMRTSAGSTLTRLDMICTPPASSISTTATT